MPEGKAKDRQLWVRLPPEIYERIKADAEREARSASGQVRYIIMRWYEMQDAETRKGG